jgi:hypothetical protein
MTDSKETTGSDSKCCSEKTTSSCSTGAGCRCFKAFLLVLLGVLAGFFLSKKCPWTPSMCRVTPSVSAPVIVETIPVEIETEPEGK